MTKLNWPYEGMTRRNVLKAGAAAVGGAMLTPGLTMPVFAADKPAIGTWPAGSSGSSVFLGVTVPRTGTYAAQGEDELKGVQLAVEHLNSGDALIKKSRPRPRRACSARK